MASPQASTVFCFAFYYAIDKWGLFRVFLEGLDGQLSVQHNRRVIPTQEAPPHPGILRHFNGRSPNQDVPSLNSNGIGRRWAEVLASLDRERERAAGTAHDGAVANGLSRTPRNIAGARRKPTPLQIDRWKAVQKAKRRGLSIRGIARALGIHRSTVKKYMEAKSPPVARSRVPSETPGSDNMVTLNK